MQSPRRRFLFVLVSLFFVFVVGCQRDGLDSPDEIIDRAKSLCACDSKACVDEVTQSITSHTEKVKAKYPNEVDVPKDVMEAMKQSRKTMMDCMMKLDQLSGHTPPEPTKKTHGDVSSPSTQSGKKTEP